MSETIVCTVCGKEFHATTEYFHKSKTGKHGLRAQCKKCMGKIKKKRYGENREKIIANARKWQEANKAKVEEDRKRYYDENKANLLEYWAQYREENKDKIKAYQRLYCENHKEDVRKQRKEYYKKNKERIRAQSVKYNKENREQINKAARKYYEANKEKFSQKRKRWCELNPDKKRAMWHRREAQKKKLPASLTSQQWKEVMRIFNNRCAYCGADTDLTQEHFIPLCKGGEYTHNNIIPACRSCNCSKQDKDFFEWYSEREFYSRKREKFILDYLDYSGNVQQLSIL